MKYPKVTYKSMYTTSLYKDLTINEKINVRSRKGKGYNNYEMQMFFQGIYILPYCSYSTPTNY